MATVYTGVFIQHHFLKYRKVGEGKDRREVSRWRGGQIKGRVGYDRTRKVRVNLDWGMEG